MKRKWTILALVVGMVGALLATAGVASGVPGDPVVVDAGVLRLHLGDTDNLPDRDYFRFDPANPSGGYSVGTEQVITPGKKCDDFSLVGTAYAWLSAEVGKWGLVDDGIGVRVTGPQGTRCGQFDNGEVLIFDLGPALDGKMIDFAELDIEIKFDATVIIEAFDSADSLTTPVFTETIDCVLSDCGPDSADGDNFRFLVEEFSGEDRILFDRLTFGVTSPGSNQAASLEGGADGTPPWLGGLAATSLGNTKDSLFHLVEEFDGTLNCGDDFTIGDGIIDAQLTVLRGGQTDCIEKLYRAETSGSSASFFPYGPATDPPSAVPADFTALIVWPTELRGAVGDVDVTQIDFDGPEGTEFDPVDVQWCLGDPDRESNPTSIDFLTVDEEDAFTGPPALPDAGETPWCLLDQVITYDSGGEIKLTEYYYGTEIDPAFGR